MRSVPAPARRPQSAGASVRAKAPQPGFFARHRLEIMVVGGMVAGVLLLLGVVLAFSGRGKEAPAVAAQPATLPGPSASSASVASPAPAAIPVAAPVIPPAAPPTWKFEPVPGQLTADRPNILGLPLAGDAACPGVQIVIDGAEELDPVRADLHRLLARGLTRTGGTYPHEVSIRYSRNTEDPALTVGPTKPGEVAEERVLAALQAVPLAGLYKRYRMDRALHAHIARADAERSGNLVLIVGHRFHHATVDAMRKDLEVRRHARIDIVVVGDKSWQVAPDSTLAKLAEAHGGRMWVVSNDEVRRAAAKP